MSAKTALPAKTAVFLLSSAAPLGENDAVSVFGEIPRCIDTADSHRVAAHPGGVGKHEGAFLVDAATISWLSKSLDITSNYRYKLKF